MINIKLNYILKCFRNNIFNFFYTLIKSILSNMHSKQNMILITKFIGLSYHRRSLDPLIWNSLEWLIIFLHIVSNPRWQTLLLYELILKWKRYEYTTFKSSFDEGGWQRNVYDHGYGIVKAALLTTAHTRCS